MTKKKVLVSKGDLFILHKCTKASGRIYYELMLNPDNVLAYSSDDFTNVRDIIDPDRIRAGRWGISWRYTNRKAAEKDMLKVLLNM